MEEAILVRAIEITAFSAAIFLMVLLFRGVMKRWLSARTRYLMWFLVVLRLLVPVTWESGVHFITLPVEAQPAVSSTPAPATARPLGGMATLSGETSAPTVAEAALPRATAQLPQEAPAVSEPLTLAQWLLVAWGAGACLVLAAHVAMTAQLERRIRALGRAPDEGTMRLYERLRQMLGVRAAPRVVTLPDIVSPALTARIRPKLLLPAGIAGGGAREDKAFSLVHELTHYQRGDHLVCLLLTLLRAIWWFNPVVWAFVPLMRIDMESACDAQVVRRMDKRQKLQYAGLLLELGAEE